LQPQAVEVPHHLHPSIPDDDPSSRPTPQSNVVSTARGCSPTSNAPASNHLIVYFYNGADNGSAPPVLLSSLDYPVQPLVNGLSSSSVDVSVNSVNECVNVDVSGVVDSAQLVHR
jgi:hypothetical protein